MIEVSDEKMSYSRISTADKERLIAAYQNGNDYQELARAMGLAEQLRILS